MDDQYASAEEPFYRHPLVAELAWIIGSPPIMGQQIPGYSWIMPDVEWYQHQLEVHRSWLGDLNEDPVALEKEIYGEHLLLGKRFEKLVNFWFRHSPAFELILSNYPVQGEKNTLGEIDLLVLEKSSNTVFHIELACKFYLGNHNSAAWNQWIGPNGNDNLELKMHKLKRQLAIFDLPEAKQILKERQLPKPEPVLFMKGYFFHHFSSIASAKSPRFSYRDYPSGWFVRSTETALFPGAEGRWIELQKNSWLSTIHLESNFMILSGLEIQERLKNHFNTRKTAVMIARVEEVNGFLREIDRGFIVQHQWPNKP